MPDTDLGYFESMYGKDPDPWGFDRRWYERRKYALTLAALPRERFRRGLEAGCANGALTELLAPRCQELYAFDLVEAAVERAIERMGSHPHVHVTRGRYPDHWPPGTGDLVVWSEIAYYLAEESAAAALDGLRHWLEPGGTLIAVHYTGATNYPRHGSEIGPWLDGSGFLRRTTHLTDEAFDLGVWLRPRGRAFPAPSRVAAAAGGGGTDPETAEGEGRGAGLDVEPVDRRLEAHRRHQLLVDDEGR